MRADKLETQVVGAKTRLCMPYCVCCWHACGYAQMYVASAMQLHAERMRAGNGSLIKGLCGVFLSVRDPEAGC